MNRRYSLRPFAIGGGLLGPALLGYWLHSGRGDPPMVPMVSSGPPAVSGLAPARWDLDDNPESAELDAVLTDCMARARMPGLSACIFKGGELRWCKGYGLADIAAGRPVTPDTAFLMGSVSKTVTVTTLMQLWERGAFQLDDNVGRFVPFRVAHPHTLAPFTLRGLLTHTASVRDNWTTLNYLYHYPGQPAMTLGETVTHYFDPSGAYYDPYSNFLPDPPGTLYEYANMGVTLAAYLAEIVTQRDFADLSRERVIEPLGMRRTSWRISDFAPEDLAMPYAWNGRTHVPYGHYTFADYPDGSLRTTAPDLARFLATISLGGALDGVRILKESTVEEMLRPQVPKIRPVQGLIFYHVETGPDHWIGHDGAESGAATQAYYRTRDGLGFVLFMNGDWGDPEPITDIRKALIEFGETLP